MRWYKWLILGGILLLGLLILINRARSQLWPLAEDAGAAKKKSKRVKDHPEDTIFVSIVSYRDATELSRTVQSLFAKAVVPNRVTVGVHEQTAEDPLGESPLDAAFEDIYEGKFSENVRVLSTDCGRSEGPMWARAKVEKQLYRGEKYYMQIDSHTRFAQDWDAKLIDMMANVEASTPVITAVPANFDHETEIWEHTSPTFSVVTGLDAGGFPILGGKPFASAPARCYKTPLVCPGFLFTLGSLIKKAPTDDVGAFLFFPECLVQSARYFTHGARFYSPTEAVVAHCVDRSYRPLYWEQMTRRTDYHRLAAATARCASLLYADRCTVCDTAREHHTEDRGHPFMAEHAEQDDVHTTHGLGSHSSLEKFREWCGVGLGAGTDGDTRIMSPCRMGVVGDGKPSHEERVNKYGNVRAYKKALSRL